MSRARSPRRRWAAPGSAPPVTTGSTGRGRRPSQACPDRELDQARSGLPLVFPCLARFMTVPPESRTDVPPSAVSELAVGGRVEIDIDLPPARDRQTVTP